MGYALDFYCNVLDNKTHELYCKSHLEKVNGYLMLLFNAFFYKYLETIFVFYEKLKWIIIMEIDGDQWLNLFTHITRIIAAYAAIMTNATHNLWINNKINQHMLASSWLYPIQQQPH